MYYSETAETTWASLDFLAQLPAFDPSHAAPAPANNPLGNDPLGNNNDEALQHTPPGTPSAPSFTQVSSSNATSSSFAENDTFESGGTMSSGSFSNNGSSNSSADSSPSTGPPPLPMPRRSTRSNIGQSPLHLQDYDYVGYSAGDGIPSPSHYLFC
ncbi:unnamed protein product [Linum trigynum]|uniref:Uncharacterized protein n=1 Tax=Linum trigynum TaxID=586398 RepID=A0AAV2F6S4_9ROSI